MSGTNMAAVSERLKHAGVRLDGVLPIATLGFATGLAKVLTMLLEHTYTTSDEIAVKCELTNSRHTKVHVQRIRKKLRAWDIEVKWEPALGYYMDMADKLVILEKLEERVNAILGVEKGVEAHEQPDHTQNANPGGVVLPGQSTNISTPAEWREPADEPADEPAGWE